MYDKLPEDIINAFQVEHEDIACRNYLRNRKTLMRWQFIKKLEFNCVLSHGAGRTWKRGIEFWDDRLERNQRKALKA
jgi:hypothetical protein